MSLRFLSALLVSLATTTQAQVVRGTVVDATGKPVSGVVVGLVDSTQSVVARSLTNDLGEYRVSAPRPGTYFLQTRRVGFQPGVSMPRVLAEATVTVERVVVEGVRVSLSTVHVVGRSACGRNSADAGTVLAAWDQAMTSLAATSLTASGRGLTATTMQIDRVLEPGGRKVRSQEASVRTEYVAQPWRTLPPDTLRRRGYAQTDGDGWTTYNAPGLDALVSPLFLEDHCVRLVSGRDTSEVGVAFEPVPARRRMSEIRGTLWLERGSAQLRRLDFTYTGGPVQASEFEAGGSMAFAQLVDGGVVISGWEIRMPQLVRDTPKSVKVRVEAVTATGGQVVVMRRGADTLFKRAALRVTGIVQDSASGTAIARASVSLSGTPLQMLTGDDGRFAFPDVLPGEYAFRVRTPSLDSMRASSQSTVMVTEGMQSLRLRVPTASQLAGALCGNTLTGAAGRGKGAVLGSVRIAGDTTPSGIVTVAADWTDIDVRGGAVQRTGRRMETRSDSSGGFRLCGVPTETALTVRALPSRGRSQPVSVRLQPDERFASATLMIDRTREAVATFAGVVVADSSDRPLADAEVSIPSLSLSTRSDARGAFRLPDVPAGSHEVLVRRLGYGAMTAAVTFAPNDEEERRIVLRPMNVLDSVEVVASRIDPGMAAFEENRRLGLGHFITREELDKNQGRKIGDLLAMVPGSGVVRGRTSGAWIMSKRFVIGLAAATSAPDAPVPSVYKPSKFEKSQGIVIGCYAQVYLDGQLQNPSQPTEPFDVNSIPLTQIEAVEWYASPAQTPSKYSRLGSPCGVLVIHTRRYDGR